MPAPPPLPAAPRASRPRAACRHPAPACGSASCGSRLADSSLPPPPARGRCDRASSGRSCALGSASSRITTRGVLTSPASIASFRPKSETIQSNSAGLGAGLAGRRKGRRREIEAALDAPRLVDAVQPLDPARRLVQVDAQLLGVLLADLHLGRLAVGVVRLVVDDRPCPCSRPACPAPAAQRPRRSPRPS